MRRRSPLTRTSCFNVQVAGSTFGETESRELLHRVAGRGLHAAYRFTRRTHLASDRMVDVEITFTNQGDSEVSDVAVGNKVGKRFCSQVLACVQYFKCFFFFVFFCLSVELYTLWVEIMTRAIDKAISYIMSSSGERKLFCKCWCGWLFSMSTFLHCIMFSRHKAGLKKKNWISIKNAIFVSPMLYHTVWFWIAHCLFLGCVLFRNWKAVWSWQTSIPSVRQRAELLLAFRLVVATIWI